MDITISYAALAVTMLRFTDDYSCGGHLRLCRRAVMWKDTIVSVEHAASIIETFEGKQISQFLLRISFHYGIRALQFCCILKAFISNYDCFVLHSAYEI